MLDCFWPLSNIRANSTCRPCLLAPWIVQYFFFLNPAVQASSHFLWLYRPFYLRQCRKHHQRPNFSHQPLFEPPHGKTNNLHRRKQRRRSASRPGFTVTAKLISAFVFATRIVQFLLYLTPKFQASSSFL